MLLGLKVSRRPVRSEYTTLERDLHVSYDIKSNPLKVRYGGGTGTGAPLRWTFFLLEPKLFGYRPGRNYPPGAASRRPVASQKCAQRQALVGFSAILRHNHGSSDRRARGAPVAIGIAIARLRP